MGVAPDGDLGDCPRLIEGGLHLEYLHGQQLGGVDDSGIDTAAAPP